VDRIRTLVRSKLKLGVRLTVEKINMGNFGGKGLNFVLTNGEENVDLYTPSPIRLRGLVLS
jgi:hypothetical protein